MQCHIGHIDRNHSEQIFDNTGCAERQVPPVQLDKLEAQGVDLGHDASRPLQQKHWMPRQLHQHPRIKKELGRSFALLYTIRKNFTGK